ncbi:hypothetical protein NB689_002730 [Xanthomonas sacchari]|nr:hypothetical protein [Xanthomonas sacchari]
MTTLKRSPGCRSLSKSMSYLKISSVIVAIADGDSPALRAATYSELVISPLVTTVRVLVSRSITFSLMSSSSSDSSTRWVASRSKRRARRSPVVARSKPISAPGRSLVSASCVPGWSSTRCITVAGRPSFSNTEPRVCPDSIRTTCQLSVIAACCCWASEIGGNGSASVACVVCSGTSMALEKPGTIVATIAPMVANRLAWIQWRRVQRPAGRCSFNLRCSAVSWRT